MICIIWPLFLWKTYGVIGTMGFMQEHLPHNMGSSISQYMLIIRDMVTRIISEEGMFKQKSG